MSKIKVVEQKVFEALTNNDLARKDDFVLVRIVYESYLPAYISFEDAMQHHTFYKLPPFESITRARRKLQALYPSLKDNVVAELREAKEEEFEEYARERI